MRKLRKFMGHIPGTITCRQAEIFIEAYVNGNLPTHSMVIFKMHLAMCRECRDYLQAFNSARALAKASLDKFADDLPEMPEEMIEVIVKTLEESGSK